MAPPFESLIYAMQAVCHKKSKKKKKKKKIGVCISAYSWSVHQHALVVSITCYFSFKKMKFNYS